jgi:A/G-specific adenine glycosylase
MVTTKFVRDPANLTKSSMSRFRTALLAWFDQHRRPLPWRETRDPYRVWLSEIMLQQTRVNAVLEHYHGFLRRFPDVTTLAAAPLDSVLAVWSGLGYYRRARALHQAARIIVLDRGGRFPSTAEDWRHLPGVGRYTAAAIASIAFGNCCAVVDGNVERVLSRLLARKVDGVEGAPHLPGFGRCGLTMTCAETWTIAESLLSKRRPGDFNQAMMELGAMVCLPKTPRCDQCPVRRWCGSRDIHGTSPKDVALVPALSVVEGSRRRVLSTAIRQPAPPSNAARRKSRLQYAFCRRERSVLLVPRSQQEPQMAGMWELPAAGEASEPPPLLTLRHSITNTDYLVTVQQGDKKTAAPAGARWIPVAKLTSLPLTGLARKILRRLQLI